MLNNHDLHTRNCVLHKPEYRLTSRDRQDRSVKHKNYARETDKGLKNSGIYSPTSRYNEMKRELTPVAIAVQLQEF